MTITCTVPEIWSMTDIVFCHFAYIFPFYPTNNPKNQNFERTKKMPIDIVILHLCTKNHMVYGSRDMECDRHIFHNCGSFFAWLLIYQPRKSKFWKNEKKECPEIFFVILGHILPFNPTKNHKIFEKMKKKSLEIPSFYTSASKIMIICFTVPEI